MKKTLLMIFSRELRPAIVAAITSVLGCSLAYPAHAQMDSSPLKGTLGTATRFAGGVDKDKVMDLFQDQQFDEAIDYLSPVLRRQNGTMTIWPTTMNPPKNIARRWRIMIRLYLFKDPLVLYTCGRICETELHELTRARRYYRKYLALAKPESEEEKKAYRYVRKRWGK
jgi:hypothetical protein